MTAFVQDKTVMERGLFDPETAPEELTVARMARSCGIAIRTSTRPIKSHPSARHRSLHADPEGQGAGDHHHAP